MTSEKIFEYLFRKFNIIKINALDKNHMVCRGLLQEHFCKTFVKISAETQK